MAQDVPRNLCKLQREIGRCKALNGLTVALIASLLVIATRDRVRATQFDVPRRAPRDVASPGTASGSAPTRVMHLGPKKFNQLAIAIPLQILGG